MEAQTKKYKIIVKTGSSELGNKGFVKYNVNDLLQFTQFLDQTYPGWRYFNVFTYSKDDTGVQLESYTQKRRPGGRFI